MNPYKHSEISTKRWGGKISDYYEIHKFIDSTKEICSDNRHRILHTHWAINRIINPIFGETIKNSDNKIINIKDLCEQDHILPDYRNKFIPTLSDFVECINENEIVDWTSKIEKQHETYKGDKKIKTLLMSPLMITGQLKSLLITHNSWFINGILPRIFNVELEFSNFEISMHEVFNSMNFKLWMDNGADYPISARKIKKLIVSYE